MKFGSRRAVEPEINVTSLIDVILLLVMFFMVSTTFQQEGRLKVRLPESSAVPEQRPADPVTIVVGADGAYRVNDRALVNRSPETLRAALLKVAGADPHGQPITIRADARATHQAVVTAMDIAGKVGFAQVNIATVNQQPGG
ncbi:MAG: biopolymer transporter ExbD [Proteobacteria bacterium]|nr:biopolymer transporter ExbD [Pseudomonadota bacterium]